MRKGSIREKSKPIISLKNLSEQGIVVIPRVEYKIADPTPDSWVKIKSNDIIISASGTIRLIIKKNWQEGEIESLRITWEQHGQSLEASLEVEKLEIDSSNIDYLNTALRPVMNEENSPHELKPEYFNRAVRFNILTFLGFGKIGNTIHQLMPLKTDKHAPSKFSLAFLLDSTTNKLANVYTSKQMREEKALSRENCAEIALLWRKNEENNLYKITDIAYPPGIQSNALEAITLASEIANALSTANEIYSKR